MKYRLGTEELIAIILQEDNIQINNQVINVDYTRVNSFGESLRKKGIASNFGIKEIRAAKHYYPNNIEILEKSLQITVSKDFKTFCSARIEIYDSQEISLLTNSWKESL